MQVLDSGCTTQLEPYIEQTLCDVMNLLSKSGLLCDIQVLAADMVRLVDPEFTQEAQCEPSSSKICRDKLQKQSKSTPKSTQGGKSVTFTNILAVEKQTLILPKQYRVKHYFIQKPPLGVMSIPTTINEEPARGK